MNKRRFIRNVHIHPLFWIIVVIAISQAQFFHLLLLFLIVFIHEMGHAIAALYFSWDIKRIILLPFGGVAEINEHGKRPLWEEMIVILAGPVQHLWLILLAKMFLFFSWVSPDTYQTFVEFNWMILSFNFLPILPLDGGKIMYYLFSLRWPFRLALERAIAVSGIVLFLFALSILMIFPAHLNGWLMVVFLAYSLLKEWRNRHYTFMRFLLERYGERPLITPKRHIYVDLNDSIPSVVQKFYRGMLHSIVVFDQGIPIRILSENTCLEAYFQKNNTTFRVKHLLSKT